MNIDFVQMERYQALDDMFENPRADWCYHKSVDIMEVVAWDDEVQAAYTYTYACDTKETGRRFYGMLQLKTIS
jgi:hypothetical protein